MITNRSSEELRMRELIVPVLREQFSGARIIHELPLRYSTRRIDLAAVTETEIVSVEIKSSKDVIDRLEAQVRAFAPVSSRLIVALAPCWNLELPARVERGAGFTRHIPQYTEAQDVLRRIGHHWIETWTVDAEAGSVQQSYRNRLANRPWLSAMLDMLHVAELIAIADRHRVSYGKRPTHAFLVEQIADFLTGAEVRTAVCQALRARDAFAAGTDAPIVPAAPRSTSPTRTQEVLL